jgi:hypothetical protein
LATRPGSEHNRKPYSSCATSPDNERYDPTSGSNAGLLSLTIDQIDNVLQRLSIIVCNLRLSRANAPYHLEFFGLSFQNRGRSQEKIAVDAISVTA